MRALLLNSPGDLRLTELPSAPLAPGQVRLRIEKVGVCGSDYSSIAGKLPFTRFPIVPGHEASGRVLESRSAEFAAGERVVIHPILCDRSDPVFTRGEVHHSDSTEVLGVVSRNGAYAEETVVEDYMLRRLPGDLDFERAAMLEPVAVAVRALERGGLRGGDRVLVIGAGNIGLLLVQAARALGAAWVTVTDIVPERLSLAESLGANDPVDVREGFPARLEKCFDLVVDGVGNEATVKDAVGACVRGGRIVVYGVPSAEIRLPLKAAFAKDLVLATSRLYGADFSAALRLVSEGEVRVTELITHRLALEDAPAALARIMSGAEPAIKVMITP